MQAAFEWATEDSLEAYEYKALKTKTSIRLLSLSGDTDFGYSCSLAEFELEKAPPFVALSYRWGCPYEFPELEQTDEAMTKADCERAYNRTHRFKVDGKAVVVEPGRSLHEALSVLWTRLPELGCKYIWIDAICINQNDKLDVEKPAQILLMGDIYKKATRVVAWLGPAFGRTSAAVAALTELRKIPQWRWGSMQNMSLVDKDAHVALGIKPITLDDLGALAGFLTRA